MLSMKTIFTVAVLLLLLLKHSNMQGTCEDKGDGKLFCTNGIPPDPHGKTIITVMFTSNMRYTISDGSFESETWKQVERFELTKTPSIRVTIDIMANAFVKLVQLKTLRFNMYTSVINTNNESFVGLINTTTLSLAESQRIDGSALHLIFSSNESLPNLETLVLEKSGTTSNVFDFDSVLLASLYRRPIKSLYLQSIGVVVDMRAFSGACGSLEYMNLSDSRISKYKKHSYQYDGVCNNLKVLDMSGVKLGIIICFSNRFENVTAVLTESNLRDFTPFRMVENVTFDRMCKFPSGVSFINDRIVIDVILHWKYFRTRHNNFDVFDITLQWHNCPLERFDIAENGISFLNPDFMSSCTQLAEVNLAGNRLSKMSEKNTTQFLHLFKSLLNLSVVNLARNGLKVLPKLVFSNNEKLSYLDLSDNEFTAFSLPLTHLNNLAVLSLTFNNLNLKDKSTRNNFSGFLNKSESNKLLLADNPIKCSKCEHLIVITWIVQNMRYIADSSIIYCSGEGGKTTLVQNATVAELKDICSRIYWQQMIIIIVCSSSFVLLIVSGCVTKKLLKRYRQHKHLKEDECRLLHDVIMENKMVSVLKQEQHVATFAVFLCFSGNDKDFVKMYIYESLNEKLKTRVETERDLVYLSEMHMEVGKLTKVITDGIRKCKSMLFLLSEGSCRSDDDNWCIFEFNTAMELNIPVILMVKEHVPEYKMDPGIREYFKNNSRIMWIKDEKGTYQLESSWDAVCSAILRSTTETVS